MACLHRGEVVLLKGRALLDDLRQDDGKAAGTCDVQLRPCTCAFPGALKSIVQTVYVSRQPYLYTSVAGPYMSPRIISGDCNHKCQLTLATVIVQPSPLQRMGMAWTLQTAWTADLALGGEAGTMEE